jgi:two-component system chemotaxis response regulator CheB
MTNVLVVDDSRFMRTVVGNILTSHGNVVRTAADGEEAVEAVAEHDPDVVTMDVEMPGMDGIEATDRIMRTNPTPILMLSAHTEKGAEATLRALSRGAVDFIAKPGGDDAPDIDDLEDQLIRKLKTVDRADLDSVVTTNAPSAGQAEVPQIAAGEGGTLTAGSAPTPDVEARPEAYVDDPTVVVGASTGGPKVIEAIVEALPPELDARVLIVQHMPASFTDRLAARLDTLVEYDVSEAGDGQRVTGGEIVVAKGGYHMHVAHYADGRLRLSLTEDEPLHGVRPSIDVTMASAAKRVTDPLVGVALTGMGKDGAEGIARISDAGGHTFAQDRATSPVFGIPKQAIETGCVDEVLPGEEIATGVCRHLAADPTDGDTDG